MTQHIHILWLRVRRSGTFSRSWPAFLWQFDFFSLDFLFPSLLWSFPFGFVFQPRSIARFSMEALQRFVSVWGQWEHLRVLVWMENDDLFR